MSAPTITLSEAASRVLALRREFAEDDADPLTILHGHEVVDLIARHRERAEARLARELEALGWPAAAYNAAVEARTSARFAHFNDLLLDEGGRP